MAIQDLQRALQLDPYNALDPEVRGLMVHEQQAFPRPAMPFPGEATGPTPAYGMAPGTAPIVPPNELGFEAPAPSALDQLGFDTSVPWRRGAAAPTMPVKESALGPAPEESYMQRLLKALGLASETKRPARVENMPEDDVGKGALASLTNLLRRDDVEGFSAESYPDGPDRYSWGYGTKAPGPKARITIPDAEKELAQHAVGVLQDVKTILPAEVYNSLNANQIAAVGSLLYNLGADGFMYKKADMSKRDELADKYKDEPLKPQVRNGQLYVPTNAYLHLYKGDFEKFREEAFSSDKGFVYRRGEKLSGLVKRRGVEDKVWST